jgi:hypothetical protein
MSELKTTTALDLLSISGNWTWPNGRLPLLVTDHGDHLYGTATDSRGRLIYAVLEDEASLGGGSAQRIKVNNATVLMVGLGLWLNQCATGSMRALEAMFAPEPMIEALGRDVRASYKADEFGTYRRSIDLLPYSESPLVRAHALRLAWNLRQLRETGRFNPVMHPNQWTQYLEFANRVEGEPFHKVCTKVADPT